MNNTRTGRQAGRGLAAMPKPAENALRIAVRLWDWSQWCRQVMRGIQSYAHSRPNWRLYTVSGQNESGAIFHSRQNWDGIVTHVLTDVAAIRGLMAKRGTRVVSFSSRPPTALRRLPAVRVNDEAVAAVIGRHFLAGGFRQFGYYGVRGPVRCLDFRAAAVVKFIESVNCPCDFVVSGAGAAPTLAAVVRWVARLPKPVGIFAWNMAQARTVIQACERAGIGVPEQAAVVAWDDDPVLAESIVPSISAAILPAEQLGYEAARRLDELLRGKDASAEARLVEPTGLLHIRESSDAASVPDRRVYLAAQFIRENAGRALGVTDVAACLGISRRALERQFRRVTGETVNAAILAAHVQRAKQLLVETPWPVTRIAKQAGFGTQRQLHRVFRRRESLTPQEYRKRFGGG